MNEAIITGIIAAAVSVIVAMTTAAGEKRRGQLEAVKVASDLELKLAQREDKLRDGLWADVDEKIDEQRAIIKGLNDKISKLDSLTQKQAVQLFKVNEENQRLTLLAGKQAVQLEQQAALIDGVNEKNNQLQILVQKQAVQLEQLLNENKMLRDGKGGAKKSVM